MSLFHRKSTKADSDAAASEAAVDVADATENADYDAQADLALPTSGAGSTPDDGFVPYAGELAPPRPAAGYDVERDTGMSPG